MEKLSKLFKRLANNDESAFDDIYHQTYKTLYTVAYIILKDDSQTKDVIQDVYIKLLDKIKTMDNFKFPKAYLITMTRNHAINVFNRKKKETVYDLSDNTTHVVFSNNDESVTPIEETETFHIAKKILDADELTILILCAVESFKRREVSEMLDISINTVTWKYNQAIDKVKKYMEGERK